LESQVVAGRPITWVDVHDRTSVTVITENLANRYWGDARSAIGRRIRNSADTPWREVVGVVGPVYDDGPDQAPVGLVYWPQVLIDFWGAPVFTQRSMAYVIRTASILPTSIAGPAREAVWGVNANLPVANLETLRSVVRRSTARTEFTVVMLGIAAALAVLLGVVGLYAVVSYAVAARTREIGVRMALGASRREIATLVVRQGARLAAFGLVVGSLGSMVATRLLSDLLFGVAAIDVRTLLATAALLGAVALLASYIPARRASRIEPTEALQYE